MRMCLNGLEYLCYDLCLCTLKRLVCFEVHKPPLFSVSYASDTVWPAAAFLQILCQKTRHWPTFPRDLEPDLVQSTITIRLLLCCGLCNQLIVT